MEGHGATLLLTQVFLMFVAAKVFGEIAERLRTPAVVGELLAGVVIGPAMLGWLNAGEFSTSVRQGLSELGVVFLLFVVGLETRLSDLKAVGRSATLVGVLGVVAPFVLGALFMLAIGETTIRAMFVGTALVATSVGVTARVLADLGALGLRESRIILAAAVIDDILAMLVLAVVSGVAQGGLSALKIAGLVTVAVAFVGLVSYVGTRVFRARPQILDAPRVTNSPFMVSIALCLGLSLLADVIGLAAIIGAFIAGMILAETKQRRNLEHEVGAVAGFLVPFFFVYTGSLIDLSVFRNPTMLAITAALTVIGIATKLIPCAAAVWKEGRQGAFLVGAGMIPRGEVGIIVAGLGLKAGAIDAPYYAAIVVMALATTLVAPPFLRVLVSQVPATGAEDQEPPPPPARELDL